MKLKDTFYIIFDIDMFYSWGSVKNLRDAFLTPKNHYALLLTACLFCLQCVYLQLILILIGYVVNHIQQI